MVKTKKSITEFLYNFDVLLIVLNEHYHCNAWKFLEYDALQIHKYYLAAKQNCHYPPV